MANGETSGKFCYLGVDAAEMGFTEWSESLHGEEKKQGAMAGECCHRGQSLTLKEFHKKKVKFCTGCYV